MDRARSVRYLGDIVNCPICEGHFKYFLPFGAKKRPNAMCPRCRSLERHRLLWLYLKNRTDFFMRNLRVLEIAPQYYIQRKFKSMVNLDYVSADLYSPIAMINMDITDMQFEDDSFDCVLCYHVLEHVPEDKKAMREILRVLKPGGWAILQVPILAEMTIEDAAIESPEDRERVYGQFDHVRAYGLDYKDRLEDTGFIVKEDDYVQEIGEEAIRRYGLIKGESIYFCSKRIAGIKGAIT